MKILKFIIFSLLAILICIILFYAFTDNISKTENTSSESFTNNNWLEIPILINGIKTKAIFDTGAQFSVLNESSCQKFGVFQFPVNFIKVNNQTFHKFGIISKLHINNLEFKNVIVILIDFKNEDTQLKCIDSELILGMHIIKKTIWKFDNKNLKFTNLKKNDIDSTNYTNEIKYSDNYTPLTNIKIDNQIYPVLIDFGYNSTVSISFKKLTKDRQNNYINTSCSNIFGKLKDTGKTILTDLILNKDTLENLAVDYTKSNLNIIGNQAFKYYTVVTVHPFNKEIKLLNKTQPNKSKYFFNHGFYFDKVSNTIKISFLNINSTTYKYGLRIGDEITRINNVKSDSILKKLDYCSFIQWRSEVFRLDTIKLTINREGKLIDFEIRKLKYK